MARGLGQIPVGVVSNLAVVVIVGEAELVEVVVVAVLGVLGVKRVIASSFSLGVPTVPLSVAKVLEVEFVFGVFVVKIEVGKIFGDGVSPLDPKKFFVEPPFDVALKGHAMLLRPPAGPVLFPILSNRGNNLRCSDFR